MKAVMTANTAKIEEEATRILGRPFRAREVADGWCAIVNPDTASVVGLVYFMEMTPSELRMRIIAPPEVWSNKAFRGAVEEALGYQPQNYVKISACVPASVPGAQGLFQRLGFQREGVNKASLATPDGVVDQIYLGLARAPS